MLSFPDLRSLLHSLDVCLFKLLQCSAQKYGANWIISSLPSEPKGRSCKNQNYIGFVVDKKCMEPLHLHKTSPGSLKKYCISNELDCIEDTWKLKPKFDNERDLQKIHIDETAYNDVQMT